MLFKIPAMHSKLVANPTLYCIIWEDGGHKVSQKLLKVKTRIAQNHGGASVYMVHALLAPSHGYKRRLAYPIPPW